MKSDYEVRGWTSGLFATFSLFFRSSPDLLLGVAFVGAARRSLARDSRSELGDRQWRRRWQRTLPLLVSLERSGRDQQAERFDSYDYSRCRRVFCSCVVSSFHAFLIRVDALLATFVLATLSSAWRGTAWSLTKPSRTLGQVKLGWSSWGGLSKVLAGRAYSSDPLSSHFSLVVTLFSKGRWSHSFCRRHAT